MIVKILIQAAVDANVEHIVLISLPGAKQQKILFQRQFRAMEVFLERSGIAFTVLRCTMFMDNFLAFAPSILNGQLDFPIGDGSTPLIDTRDVGECAANVLASENRSRYYVLTGPESLDCEDMAASLSQGLGINVQSRRSSGNEKTAEAFQKIEFEQWQARGFVELLNLVEAGEMKAVSRDTELLLGRKPTTLLGWTREHAVFFHQIQRQQQTAVNQQGEQRATQQELQNKPQPGAYVPHLSGHSQEWYDHYYPLHEQVAMRKDEGEGLTKSTFM